MSSANSRSSRSWSPSSSAQSWQNLGGSPGNFWNRAELAWQEEYDTNMPNRRGPAFWKSLNHAWESVFNEKFPVKEALKELKSSPKVYKRPAPRKAGPKVPPKVSSPGSSKYLQMRGIKWRQEPENFIKASPKLHANKYSRALRYFKSLGWNLKNLVPINAIEVQRVMVGRRGKFHYKTMEKRFDRVFGANGPRIFLEALKFHYPMLLAGKGPELIRTGSYDPNREWSPISKSRSPSPYRAWSPIVVPRSPSIPSLSPPRKVRSPLRYPVKPAAPVVRRPQSPKNFLVKPKQTIVSPKQRLPIGLARRPIESPKRIKSPPKPKKIVFEGSPNRGAKLVLPKPSKFLKNLPPLTNTERRNRDEAMREYIRQYNLDENLAIGLKRKLAKVPEEHREALQKFTEPTTNERYHAFMKGKALKSVKPREILTEIGNTPRTRALISRTVEQGAWSKVRDALRNEKGITILPPIEKRESSPKARYTYGWEEPWEGLPERLKVVTEKPPRVVLEKSGKTHSRKDLGQGFFRDRPIMVKPSGARYILVGKREIYVPKDYKA